MTSEIRTMREKVIVQGGRILVRMHQRGKRTLLGPPDLPQFTKHLELSRAEAHQLVGLLQLAVAALASEEAMKEGR